MTHYLTQTLLMLHLLAHGIIGSYKLRIGLIIGRFNNCLWVTLSSEPRQVSFCFILCLFYLRSDTHLLCQRFIQVHIKIPSRLSLWYKLATELYTKLWSGTIVCKRYISGLDKLLGDHVRLVVMYSMIKKTNQHDFDLLLQR